MYCGGKKYTLSSHASIISSVFPGSWFSKFRPKTTTSGPNQGQTQPKAKPDCPPRNPLLPAFSREARFYSVDGDDDGAYWRLSFREERTQEHTKGITVISPDSSSSDEEVGIAVPSFTSLGLKLAMPRRRDSGPRNLGRRRPDESVEKGNQVEMKKEFQDSDSPSDGPGVFGPSPVEKDDDFFSNETSDESELRIKSQRRRKIKRKNRAANNYSPKWELRVQALEGLKKERMRPRRKETKGVTMFDSFAEVKASYHPQEDFRQSMVEMICEQGIRRPEELEDLLACYLTLNGDEHHDLIIRVFQEVWFDLSGTVC